MAKADRGEMSDQESVGVDDINFGEKARDSPNNSIPRSSPRPDDDKNQADIDDMGREKIRITIQGKRATLVTTDMDDHHYEKLKKKSRKTSYGGVEEEGTLDLKDLAEITGEGLKHEDKVQEHELTMGEMRKQMGMLVTTMTAQSFVLLALMVLVAWMFKDQYVSDDGTLTDSNGNTLKIGSADFSVASNGLMKTPNGNAALTTAPLKVKLSSSAGDGSPDGDVRALMEAVDAGKKVLRRRLTEFYEKESTTNGRRLGYYPVADDGKRYNEAGDVVDMHGKLLEAGSTEASCTALNARRLESGEKRRQLSEERRAEIRKLSQST